MSPDHPRTTPLHGQSLGDLTLPKAALPAPTSPVPLVSAGQSGIFGSQTLLTVFLANLPQYSGEFSLTLAIDSILQPMFGSKTY